MFDPAKSKWGSRLEKYGEGGRKVGIRVLSYGAYGSGKTTFAGTFPSPLFVDMELGENLSLRNQNHPYIYLPPGDVYKTILTLLKDWIARRDVFDAEGGPLSDRCTLVLDSWTKLNLGMLTEIARADGRDVTETNATPRDYLLLTSRQNEIMNLTKELAFRHGVNIVITALPKVEGDEVEELKRAANSTQPYTAVVGMPQLLGSFRRAIGADVQEVYFHEVLDGASKVYRMHTQPQKGWHAKSRLGLPAYIDDPSYAKIDAILERRRQS